MFGGKTGTLPEGLEDSDGKGTPPKRAAQYRHPRYIHPYNTRESCDLPLRTRVARLVTLPEAVFPRIEASHHLSDFDLRSTLRYILAEIWTIMASIHP